MSSSRTHFRDPAGLVIRMLKSGDPTARAALGRGAAGIALKPLDAIMRSAERGILDRARQTPWPLILIIGPPRSGSTVLYQMLARSLPVSYFTNWSALFPHSPIAASRVAARLLTSKTARGGVTNYHNYFGNTSGLTGPNDGFHIWDRWLDTDRYRSRQALGAAASHEMQRFFDAWRTVFPQPFLNKNNRNSDCVPLLARTLTNVLFVRVRRDPIYVAQSLLLAREHIQGDRSVGWGLHSRDSVATRDPFAAIDAVCDQVMDIESKLDVNEDHVGHERFVSVEYERLCSNPGSAIERVVRRISRLCPFPEQIRTKIPPLACMNSRRISSHEMQRIEARFRAGDGRTTASLAGPAHPRLSRNATES